MALYFTFSSSISYIYKDTWILMRLVHKTNNLFSPHIIEHKKYHDVYMALTIDILAWDRRNNMEMLNRLMASQTSPLDNWTSINNAINKQTMKSYRNSLPLKRISCLLAMNLKKFETKERRYR